MKKYKLIVPKGFSKSAASISGSCGYDGSLFDLVPDNFIGVNILKACRIHDYLYLIGGKETDKVKADKMFYKNLKRCVLNQSSDVFKFINLKLAKLYYNAVKAFGNISFNYIT